MPFGNILQELIEKNNLTPSQFAEAMHISRSSLENFLRCIWEPNFGTLKRMAAYFHVTTDYLLDYQGETTQVQDHMDTDLLHAFRSMPSEQQRVFLAQVKAIAKFCATHSL